jgi:hypothetical protein
MTVHAASPIKAESGLCALRFRIFLITAISRLRANRSLLLRELNR